MAAFDNFDYMFAENGLTAYKLGEQLPSASFIQHVGEEEYKKLVNWILRYLSEVDVPIKRYATPVLLRPTCPPLTRCPEERSSSSERA